MPRDVGAYLSEQQRKSTGDVATEWGQLEELYNKKLWHQLTLKLLEFVKNPIFSKGDGLIKVKANDEAKVLCMITIGTIQLRTKDLEPTKLAHPILESLKGTDKDWLVDLLYAFNSGNIAKFEDLKKKWATQPDLAASEIPLRQKISLLCLMEVELLVMKALSLGLVKGSIDEIDQRVHMTWVQPRVLDLQQISTMQKRLEQWCTDVTQMERLLEVKAHDILT
ncbi:hypothetical protein KUTeg_007196 [Tegillarca granosa]|uniref:PSD13 N-terminal domain-containing protein n=1 Tax=Tegillarca granosa TaxID=220873 RepID=A0ABQ9FEI1_TEGGR|nr:hypothetical protein KUTeg_007195 [Tegillarca granosa]KAJ8315046.1 hypothetical protein KUTeg_007196 [Tegillarca granosa]